VDIKEQIKAIMHDKKMSYTDIGKKCGWSAQNVWIKLNMDGCPNYETISRILGAMGIQITIERDGRFSGTNPKNTAEKIEEITKDEQVSYNVIAGLIKRFGFKIEFVDTEESDQNTIY